MKIDGSCHCGKITLTAEVDPSTAMVCHCTDCQILGGGPCRTGIRSEAEKITIEGDVTEYTKVAESGVAAGERVHFASHRQHDMGIC